MIHHGKVLVFSNIQKVFKTQFKIQCEMFLDLRHHQHRKKQQPVCSSFYHSSPSSSSSLERAACQQMVAAKSMMEVAVIGAGASGLVASRHLLNNGIRPTILEASHRIGGAWNNDNGKSDSVSTGKMWDSLHTNLSKYTCSFSDHPHPPSSSNNKDFVSHQEVQRYLESYSETFVDPSCFRFGCHVTHVKLRDKSSSGSGSMVGSGSVGSRGYHVEWAEEDKNDNTKQLFKSASFDAVVVATGFFASPAVSTFVKQEEEEDNDDDDDERQQGKGKNVNSLASYITHSSKYKTPDDFKDYTQVAVCGASFSALEIAADLARNSPPGTSGKVLHILPSIPYVLSRFLPYQEDDEDDSSDEQHQKQYYMPLDCALYRRSCDGSPNDALLPEKTSLNDKQACRLRHEELQKKYIDLRKQKAAIGLPNIDDMRQPPYVAISDDYLNLVLGGQIQVVTGQRLVRATLVDDPNNGDRDDDATSSTITDSSSSQARLRLELDSGTVLSSAQHLVDCTGFGNPQLHEFLDDSILTSLAYDQTDNYAPMVMCHDTLHPDLPGLGFVGMYRGPYFGIMELQARLLAALWSSSNESTTAVKAKLTPEAMQRALQESLQIRQDKQHRRRRPQLPHFDYVGFMDALADYLDLVPRASTPCGVKKQVVLPAFYQPNLEIAQSTLDRYLHMKSTEYQTQILPRIIFNALVGQWLFQRTLTHFEAGTIRTGLQQDVTGLVKFSPQTPAPSFERTVLLYREDGVLHLPRGDMTVFREYEYSLAGSRHEQLEVHFVENGKRAGLFLNLQFNTVEQQQQQQPHQQHGNQAGPRQLLHRYEATSDHLCIKDLYSGKFQMDMDGVAIRQMTMTYRVRGPHKDYESVTKLQPYHDS
jgi:Family of unknown function (DUF6314)/Flavin-binding monooxygenase-like